MNPLSLVVTNDGSPTLFGNHREGIGPLDPVIITPTIACISDVKLTEEIYLSDNYLVVSRISISPVIVTPNSTRYNLSKVVWEQVTNHFREQQADFNERLESSINVGEIYEGFVNSIQTSLTEYGAIIPRSAPFHPRRIKPLW